MYVLSWSSRDNKPLKMPSDSISEGLIFQNFLGGMPQTPLDLACFACQIVYFAHNYHAHSNKIVPPLFRILDPPHYIATSWTEKNLIYGAN